MITYSDLYEMLRKEKYNEKLQELPKNFLKEIEIYFIEKKAVTNKESSIFNEEIIKSKKQLENAAGIIRELITNREKKILSLALIAGKTGISKKDIENMLEYEKEMFDKTTFQIEDTGRKMNLIIHGLHAKTLKNKLVRFNQDTPQFAGLDSKSLGPFKIGDIANIPKEIAKVLIDSKQAITID